MLWMQPLKRYFEFSGRSSRAEYWQFAGVVIVAITVALLIDLGSESATRTGMATNAFIVMVAVLIPFYAVTFRRLHDRGMSGWAVGILWAFNVAGFIIGAIKDSIEIALLAAPFVLLYWVVTLLQLGLGIYLLSEIVKPGDPDHNRFGPPPAE